MGENIPGTRASLNLQSICIHATDQTINQKLIQKRRVSQVGWPDSADITGSPECNSG